MVPYKQFSSADIFDDVQKLLPTFIPKYCSCAKFLSQLLIIFDTNFRKIFSEFNTRNGGIFALRFFDI